MLSTLSSLTTTPTPTRHQLALGKRMRGPQRHRLLQGYPLPPLMVPYQRQRPYEPVSVDSSRPLIVGILPHASCNPAVQGCGYCTFPHEQFKVSEVRQTVRAVIDEVSRSSLRGRRVEALYFGGGTANLTPPDVFSELCQTVSRSFDLREAEVTLEGAPVYFSSRKEALLDSLQHELECQDRRLSMGVQTFDQRLLEAMGRQHLGAPEQVRRAVRAAQRRGMTSSADLMINMPGQSLPDMLADVRQASDLGFSQICIYHLVLFRGLGTPWARDRAMLASLPDNEQAFANWLQVRDLVLSLGYRQATLTNFEREGHYRYEECSYTPERFDGAGFGPEALSCYTDLAGMTAVKWMNEPLGADYRRAMDEEGDARARCFVYGAEDLRLLFLTRSLPRLRASRAIYRQTYGSDLVSDFAGPLEALREAGLVSWDEALLRLTERGMFYADSVAGLLAADRVAQLRQGLTPDDPPVFRMG
jgi:coproporphyrinogen III oxidase-like Fe-S oxidoreductase